jgi:hypothetical protein
MAESIGLGVARLWSGYGRTRSPGRRHAADRGAGAVGWASQLTPARAWLEQSHGVVPDLKRSCAAADDGPSEL